MTNFSFTNFLGNNKNHSASGKYSGPFRKASPNQIRYYNDLCKRHKVEPLDVETTDARAIASEIEKLSSRPLPASEEQINRIVEIEREIAQLDKEYTPLNKQQLASLTGGRDGTASMHMNKIFELRRELNHIAPPNEDTLRQLVDFYLCPDIPFEALSFEKVYPMKPGANEAEMMTETVTINKKVYFEDGTWRLMTPSEFAKELQSKLTQEQAYRFIGEHRSTFFQWQRTRIREWQIERIRVLESRLSNTYTPREVTYAYVDGVQTQVSSSSSRLDYAPDGNEAMTDQQIVQLSQEQASELISLMEYETTIKTYHDSINAEAVYDESQDILNAKRPTLNAEQGKEEAYRGLEDLIFSIQAILGYEAPEIHELIDETILENSNSAISRIARDEIKEFFMSTVTTTEEEDASRFRSEMARIYNMCADNTIAIEILTS